jgi:maltose O-acetyltransferase
MTQIKRPSRDALLHGLRRARNGIRRAYAAARGVPNLPPRITIGDNVYLGRGVAFDWSHAHLIRIDDDAVISSACRVLCHDASSVRRLGIAWVAPVHVCRGAFIGAGALLLPGVTVGEGAVVAALAVVGKDVAPGTVVAGNPAREISNVRDLDAKRLALLAETPCFPMVGYHYGRVDEARIAQLRAAAARHGGYFLSRDDR